MDSEKLARLKNRVKNRVGKRARQILELVVPSKSLDEKAGGVATMLDLMEGQSALMTADARNLEGLGESELLPAEDMPKLRQCLSTYHNALQLSFDRQITADVADAKRRSAAKSWSKPTVISKALR